MSSGYRKFYIEEKTARCFLFLKNNLPLIFRKYSEAFLANKYPQSPNIPNFHQKYKRKKNKVGVDIYLLHNYERPYIKTFVKSPNRANRIFFNCENLNQVWKQLYDLQYNKNRRERRKGIKVKVETRINFQIGIYWAMLWFRAGCQRRSRSRMKLSLQRYLERDWKIPKSICNIIYILPLKFF